MSQEFLHKTSPCRGNCGRDEQTCAYAHSIHAWNPKHPKLMCSNGDKCWNKETTCAFLHDCSLADKIRVATIRNIQFIHPIQKKKPMAPPAPVPRQDPLYELQMEKAMLQSEMEAINILKKKLEVKVLEFKKKASDYWEAGSTELEF